MNSNNRVTSHLMLMLSRIIRSVLFGSLLLAGSAAVQASTIQGEVRGPDGKPISGAEVRIARRDSKESVSSVKTDKKGHYVFNGLAVGAYKLTAWVNKGSTTVDNVKARSDGAVRVDFDIKAASVAAAMKKKSTRRIWVAAETGTHIGGGYWVEVDENGRPIAPPAGTNHVEKGRGDDMKGFDQRGTYPGVPIGN